MNTATQQPAAEVKSPAALDEATVVAWLRERAATYGIRGLTLSIDGNESCSAISAAVPKPGGSSWDRHYGFADTIEAAVEKVKAEVKTPAEVAADMRKQAEKLIADAAALVAPEKGEVAA